MQGPSRSHPDRACAARRVCRQRIWNALLPWGAELGEAPIWHPIEERLYWVDILHPAIYRFDPATGLNQACKPGKLVSAVLLGRDGTLRIASQEGIEQLDFESGRTSTFVEPENGLGTKSPERCEGWPRRRHLGRLDAARRQQAERRALPHRPRW